MNVQEKLQEILDKKGTRNYIKGLKNNSELLSFLRQKFGDLPLQELFYLGLNPSLSPYCKKGKKRSFKTITDGYRPFCGIGKKCPCRVESQSDKIREKWNERSEEDKSAIFQKMKETNLERYGVDNAALSDSIRERIRQTNQERYGANSPLESAVIQEKIRQQNLDKYGCEYPLQSPIIQQKTKDTTIHKYGGLMTHARYELYKKYNGNPFVNEGIKDLIRKNYTDEYGSYHNKHSHHNNESKIVLFSKEIFKEQLKKAESCEILAEQIKTTVSTVRRYVHRYNLSFPPNHKSSKELEIFNFIKDLGFDVRSSVFIDTDDGKREIDIIVPEKALAIEYCGLYWHGEVKGRTKFYHQNKLVGCQDAGYQLITIFEDEYLDNSERVKSFIRNKLGLSPKGTPARKLKVKLISLKEANKFLSIYHIQGSVSTAKINYGAFDSDKLVGVMCFSRGSDNSYELVRFAGDGEIHNGMASKLLKYFINDKEPTYITSFADLRWSDGNLYQKLGFVEKYITDPTYYYTDYQNRWHRSSFMKGKIRKKFNLPNDFEFTEKQFMFEQGYDRIWDCGKIKFVLEL